MDDDGSTAGSVQLGIRREGDACFHPVEEEVPEGYIVDGILIRREDVVETTTSETCRRPVLTMKLPEPPVSAPTIVEPSPSPAGGGQGRGCFQISETVGLLTP